MNKIHFIGIGGIGMSAIAQFLSEKSIITGSDRNFDLSINLNLKKKLENLNIKIFKQDGSGIDKKTNKVVYSSAIENNNKDIIKSKQLSIPKIHRSKILKEIVSNKKTIAISGTSGKTTTSAIIFSILNMLNVKLDMINGGNLIKLKSQGYIGNAINNNSKTIVFEADESDSSLVNYNPNISIITNITMDHMSLEKLYELFIQFANQTKDLLIYNIDCPNINKIAKYFNKDKQIITYGFKENANYKISNYYYKNSISYFEVNNKKYTIKSPGIINAYNCIAGIVLGYIYKKKYKDIKNATIKFDGVERRMQKIKTVKNINIFDDYAHNPAKIKTAIENSKVNNENIIAIFQPHGFTPTKLMKNDLIKAITNSLKEKDIILITEIFYLGGTVEKNISSKDIVNEINKVLKRQAAYYFQNRNLINNFLKENRNLLKDKSNIIVMGARDNTLNQFCQIIDF